MSGTIDAADVVGPAVQGIAAGELGELMDAIDAGAAYVNVHSAIYTGGEIRAQLKPGPAGPQGPVGPAGQPGATGPQRATGPRGRRGRRGRVTCKVIAPKKVKCMVRQR